MPPVLRKRVSYWSRAVALFCGIFIWRPIAFVLYAPPHDTPRAIAVHLRRRSLANMISVVVFVLFILFSEFMMETALGHRNITFVIRPLLILVAYYGTDAVVKWKLKRVERDSLSSGYERCLNCGYALKGLPERHVCPECGQAYILEDVVQTWTQYLGEVTRTPSALRLNDTANH